MWTPDPSTLHAWSLFTRLGEAQILLPAALVVSGPLLRHADGRAVALRWWALLLAAIALTTASKVAFIGWGIGSARWDFTGISGHTMFAAAVYPMLLAALLPPGWPRARTWAASVGMLLAAAVAVSRVVVGAHSVSEVVAGMLAGGAAGACAWALGSSRSRLAALLMPLVLAWLLTTPWVAPPSNTHGMVTRLALALSGYERPCTRAGLLSGHVCRAQGSRHAKAGRSAPHL